MRHRDFSPAVGNTCQAPGCEVTGAYPTTCAIWAGRRLCWGHFARFTEHPLSDICSIRGSAPTAVEWDGFLLGLAARGAA